MAPVEAVVIELGDSFAADDPTVHADVAQLCAIDPEQVAGVRLQLEQVALDDLGQAAPDAESYLIDGDEDCYVQVVEMTDCYALNGADSLPPLIMYTRGDELGLVDGWHRLAAARAAGLEQLPVLRIIDPVPGAW